MKKVVGVLSPNFGGSVPSFMHTEQRPKASELVGWVAQWYNVGLWPASIRIPTCDRQTDNDS